MNPAAKKLFEYGIVGFVIATALVAGLQVRPSSVLPSTGSLQVEMTSDPSTVSGGHNAKVNVTSLVVTISSVSIHRTGAFNLTGDWINVTSFPKSIDLVTVTSTTVLLGSITLPEGQLNLVRIEVQSATATTTSSCGSGNVVVSGGHLQAQISTQVQSGKTTTVVVNVVQPHLVCEGNGRLRLTPELTTSSEGPD